MRWCDFYGAFWDWSDSTRRTRISSLEDIGSGEEVVEAVLEIEDPKVKAQLIRKAMKLGAEFAKDDLINLDTELPDDLFGWLGKYAGIDTDDLYSDEEDVGPVVYQSKNVLDNFVTDEQITQLENTVNVLRERLDEQFPEQTPQKSQRNMPAKGCLQNMIEFGLMSIMFMIILIVGIMLLIASGD